MMAGRTGAPMRFGRLRHQGDSALSCELSAEARPARLAEVQSPTLRALANVGTYPDDAGNVRLYHATLSETANAIIAEMRLLPKAPRDPAEAMLLRGHGYIYLASSASIGRDLASGFVVLAVDVAAAALPADPLREAWGEPPRVELELKMPLSAHLPLAYADRLDRTVALADLDPAVQAAIQLFAESPVGRQLSDPAQSSSGKCQQASLRFLAALREKGTDGRLLAWAGPTDTWWHCTVQPHATDAIVDWTARQFDPTAPCPRIETRAVAEVRWNLPTELDVDTPLGRKLGDLPAVRAWSEAREVIP
jgi:hypothetical protein